MCFDRFCFPVDAARGTVPGEVFTDAAALGIPQCYGAVCGILTLQIVMVEIIVGQHIKRIDRDWAPMSEKGMDIFQDPRALFWRFWYGKDYRTGHETMINVPSQVIRWNSDLKAELWTEKTLQKQMDK